MRLVVCSTRAQQSNLARQYPQDHVIVVGDRTHGLAVSKIIDMRSFPPTPKRREWEQQWWDQVQCRIAPQEIGTQKETP